MRKLKLLVFLLLLNIAAMAQTQRVTGTVTDSKTGAALASVTVKVKGKNIQAVADVAGNFSISVPAGSTTLEFSYVGYATKTVEVSADAKSIAVTMDVLVGNNNPEVIVTALGINKESRKVGYAVTTVSSEQFNKARETNVALSLSGQVAGLNVHGTSGGPGGTARILLRGMPAITSNGSPLFVVNGVPIDNNQRGSAGEWGGADNGDGIGNLNPDDIESMTILKGQAASAIYGARASNGVILITTKSGKKGSFSVEYNGNYQIDKAMDFTDFQYVYGQGQQGQKPTSSSDAQSSGRLSWGAKMDGSQVIQFDNKSYAYSPQKNNINDFYRTAPTFTNTVSVSRGTESGSFRLSFSNLDNKSILRNSGLERKSVVLNLDQKITDKLKISVLANYTDQQYLNRPQLSDGPLNANNIWMLATSMNQSVLKPGYNASNNGAEIQFSDDEYVTNPWFVVNQYVNNIGRKRLISAVTVKYDITSWLYAQGRVGYDLENDKVFNVTPWGTAYSTSKKGSLSEDSHAENSIFNAEGILGANHSITKDIQASLIVGGNTRTNQYEKIGISGGPFVLPYFYSYGNVLNYSRSYGYSNSKENSVFYSADITYKNYLTLGTTGRWDAFSTLPVNNNRIFVPSVSAGFTFSDLLKLPSVNFGKFRASYANTSGQPPNPYNTSVYYSVGNAINGVSTGNFNASLPNGLLKPFKLTEVELGLEMKFFKNRLGFDVAYFNRKSKSEIIGAQYSWSTGYSSGYVPTGSVQNKGIELSINGTPVQQKFFNWNVSFNITSVHNKILETDLSGNNLNQGTDRFNHGNAITSFVKGEAGPQILVHDYKYDSKGNIVVDANGLPVSGNWIKMGSVLPTLYGGLRNDFSYKNFNLSFLVDYNFGNKIISNTKAEAVYRGLDKSTLVGRESGITVGVFEDGTANNVVASAQNYYQALATNVQKISVLSGDYIKLRQITFGYTISEKVLGHVPVIKAVQVSLVARNLFTLLRHSDNIDPENSIGSGVSYTGIEGNSLPSARTYGVNVNIKFK